MIPQATVQSTLLAASLKVATMVNANLTALTGGNLSVSWKAIKRAQRGINAVQRQYNLNDFSSANFLTAYGCLQNFVGMFGAGAINPNAQVSGTIIEIIGTGTDFTSSAPILFGPVTTFTISNYNLLYYSTYGNNPIFTLYTYDLTQSPPTEQEDTSTDPVLTRVTPSDPTSLLLSATWTWGQNTTGYIIISGPEP